MRGGGLLQAFVVAAVLSVLSGPAFAAATVTLINGDAANVGLNDPTPAAPVAGNTGTTVGQQRLIAPTPGITPRSPTCAPEPSWLQTSPT